LVEKADFGSEKATATPHGLCGHANWRWDVAQTVAWSFISLFECFRPCLSSASFRRLIVFSAGWVLTAGRHAVTQALVEAKAAGRLHHAAFHRVFSRARWSIDDLGKQLFFKLRGLAGEVVDLVIDDTLSPGKGSHVYGMASHVDPVRSTRRHKSFAFGLCWVVLSIRLRFRFSRRTWALPLLFRLYRPPSSCSKEEVTRKKTEHAADLLALVASWVPGERLVVALDIAYCCRELLTRKPENVTILGALKLNSVLHAPVAPRNTGRRGRPRTKGERLGNLQELLKNPKYPWQKVTADMDGRPTEQRVKVFDAMWPYACPNKVLRIAIVECTHGDRRYRAFLSTDVTWTAERILAGYRSRWSTEVTFHDGKQFFGFADSSARTQQAVERTTPFVGLLFSLLVVWYAEALDGSSLATWPLRPWYRHKTDASFEDVLRAARRALDQADISTMVGLSPSLQKRPPPRPRPVRPAA
jgi:hypothetical protein